MQTRRPLQVRLVNQLPVVEAGLPLLLAPYADRVVVTRDDSVRADIVLLDPAPHHRFDAPVSPEAAAAVDAAVVLYTCLSPVELAPFLVSESVAGYVHFSAPACELVATLETLVHEPRAVSLAAGELPHGPHGEELSTREWEVLQLIAAGDSNQQIADDLFLSLNTIKTYVRTGYAKIDVTSRSQAVAWVLSR
jgi:two-component system, NarL family, response regulator LiaR